MERSAKKEWSENMVCPFGKLPDRLLMCTLKLFRVFFVVSKSLQGVRSFWEASRLQYVSQDQN